MEMVSLELPSQLERYFLSFQMVYLLCKENMNIHPANIAILNSLLCLSNLKNNGRHISRNLKFLFMNINSTNNTLHYLQLLFYIQNVSVSSLKLLI